MTPASTSANTPNSSPDPNSHALNVYDASVAGGEWLDEDDDDDMDFEPATDESEDTEFFDPSEEIETDFHGMFASIELFNHQCCLSFPTLYTPLYHRSRLASLV